MTAIADIFTGGDNIERTANAAADQIGFNPFNINGGSLGGVSFDPETGQISLGAGQLEQQFGGLFAGLGGDLIDQSTQGGPFGPLAGGLAEFQQQAGGLGNLFAGQGQRFSEAGNQALSALGNFNPDEFATNQFERLNRLAAPGETTQARQAAQSLFSSGRLGQNDTRSGEVFRNLDLSQGLQRDARLGQAIGLAGTESDRLAGRASAFAGLGGNFLGAAGDQFLNRFGAAGTALGQNQSFQGQRFGQGLGLIQSLQGFQQSPLSLLGPSLAAAAGQSTAATAAGQLRVGGATEAANSRGNFFSGLLGAFGGA